MKLITTYVGLDGRVEERRGVASAIRFPSPLIERSMQISCTTLSDWFRCKAHGGNPSPELRVAQR